MRKKRLHANHSRLPLCNRESMLTRICASRTTPFVESAGSRQRGNGQKIARRRVADSGKSVWAFALTGQASGFRPAFAGFS